MDIGDKIKTVRTAKNLSQKEVALALDMDQAQFSRIESGKTDPSFSTIEKIAKALGVYISELVNSEEIFKDVNSYDKTLMEKVRMIEQLDEVEKKAFFAILDSLVAKRKLKETLSSALSLA